MMPAGNVRAMILDAFGEMGQLAQHMNHYAIMDWALYDRYRAPAGNWPLTGKLEFFSVPFGHLQCLICNRPRRDGRYCAHCGANQSRQKTASDCNIYEPNRLLAPQIFSLNKRLYFLFSPEMSAPDRDFIQHNYHWELRLGRCGYGTGPLARFPNVLDFDTLELAPYSTPIDDAGLIERNTLWINSQKEDRRQPAFRADHSLDAKVPIVIEWEWPFQLDLIGPEYEPEGPINIMCVFEGLMCHGVQC
jgi:hypothetical protein